MDSDQDLNAWNKQCSANIYVAWKILGYRKK